MANKLETVDDIKSHLMKRLKYAIYKVETGHHMGDDLSKWGGYRVGYAQARLRVYEELLDDIYGDDSWKLDIDKE